MIEGLLQMCNEPSSTGSRSRNRDNSAAEICETNVYEKQERGCLPCHEDAAGSIESLMRPHCLNRDDCAAKNIGKHCKRCAMTAINRSLEKRTQLSEWMKTNSPWLNPEVRAKAQTPEARAKRAIRSKAAHAARTPDERSDASRRAMQTRMAWCPDGYIGLYRHLTRSKHLKPAEARAIVLRTAAWDAQREARAVRRQIAEFNYRQRERAAREKAQAY